MTAFSALEDSALTHLRMATAEHHQHLEALVESLGMLLSLEGYARHLSLLHAHCASYVALLGAEPLLQSLIAERQQELKSDLRALGQEVAATPTVDRAPLSRAECFGFTYVMEGSRLGAVAIASRLAKRGIEVRGLASFRRPPSLVRAGWLAWCRHLGTLSSDEWEAASASAVASFRSLISAHLTAAPASSQSRHVM